MRRLIFPIIWLILLTGTAVAEAVSGQAVPVSGCETVKGEGIAGKDVMAAECGGGLLEPDSVGKLFLWLDSEKNITLNGWDAAAWTDSSDNAFVFQQGTASKQPGYVTNDLNGKAALTFDGSTPEFLDLSTAWSDPSQPFTVFVVFENTGGTGNERIYDSGTGSRSVLTINEGAGTIIFHEGSDGSFSFTYGSASIVSAIINGASTEAWQAGNSAGTANSGTNSLGEMRIGITQGGGASLSLSGSIYSLIIYNGALSAADHNTVLAYLADRYGLTVTTVSQLYWMELIPANDDIPWETAA